MDNKLAFTDYNRNGWWYGGKVTKKNFEEVVAFIKRCTHGPVGVDRKKHTISFQSHMLKDEMTVTQLGDYIVRDVGGGDFGVVLGLKPYQFKSQYSEVKKWGQLRFYDLTPIEYQVIQALSHDNDMCYSYDWIMDYTKVDREETKKAVDHLRELQIVTFQRGLMNDDGEVAGSGFGINEVQQELMAELLCLRYEKRNQ